MEHDAVKLIKSDFIEEAIRGQRYAITEYLLRLCESDNFGINEWSELLHKSMKFLMDHKDNGSDYYKDIDNWRNVIALNRDRLYGFLFNCIINEIFTQNPISNYYYMMKDSKKFISSHFDYMNFMNHK